MTKEEARDKLKKELQIEFDERWPHPGNGANSASGYTSGDFAARAVQQLTERLADLMVRVDELEAMNTRRSLRECEEP
jgi:hypothetical protein